MFTDGSASQLVSGSTRFSPRRRVPPSLKHALLASNARLTTRFSLRHSTPDQSKYVDRQHTLSQQVSCDRHTTQQTPCNRRLLHRRPVPEPQRRHRRFVQAGRTHIERAPRRKARAGRSGVHRPASRPPTPGRVSRHAAIIGRNCPRVEGSQKKPHPVADCCRAFCVGPHHRRT